MEKKCLFLIALLFSFLGVQQTMGQVAIGVDAIQAETQKHYAMTDDFNIGKLTVPMNFTQNLGSTATVEIQFPVGISYVLGTVNATGATVTYDAAASTPQKAVFKLSGINAPTATPVEMTLDRRLSKATYQASVGTSLLLNDKVKVVYGSFQLPEVKSNDYTFLSPHVQVKDGNNVALTPQAHNDAAGIVTNTFRLLNSGDGKVKKIY